MKVEIRVWNKTKTVERDANHVKAYSVVNGAQVQTAIRVGDADGLYIVIGTDPSSTSLRGIPSMISDIQFDVSRYGGFQGMKLKLKADAADVAIQQEDHVEMLVVIGQNSATFVGFVNSVQRDDDTNGESTSVEISGYCKYICNRVTISGLAEAWNDPSFLAGRSLYSYADIAIDGMDYELDTNGDGDPDLLMKSLGLSKLSALQKGYITFPEFALALTFSGEQWYGVMDKLVDLANAASPGFEDGQYFYKYYWNVEGSSAPGVTGVVNVKADSISTKQFTLPSAPFRLTKVPAHDDVVTEYKPSSTGASRRITNYFVNSRGFNGYIPPLPTDPTVGVREGSLDLSFLNGTEESLTPLVTNILALSNNNDVAGRLVLSRVSNFIPIGTKITVLVNGVQATYRVSSVSYALTPFGLDATLQLGDNYRNLGSLIREFVKTELEAKANYDRKDPDITVALDKPSRTMTSPSYIGSNPIFWVQAKDVESGVYGVNVAYRKESVNPVWAWCEVPDAQGLFRKLWVAVYVANPDTGDEEVYKLDAWNPPSYGNWPAEWPQYAKDAADIQLQGFGVRYDYYNRLFVYDSIVVGTKPTKPPPLGFEFDLKNGAPNLKGTVFQVKFKAVDYSVPVDIPNCNSKESDHREYTVDKEDPVATLSVEDVRTFPDDLNENNDLLSYTEVTNEFRLWINVTEKSRIASIVLVFANSGSPDTWEAWESIPLGDANPASAHAGYDVESKRYFTNQNAWSGRFHNAYKKVVAKVTDVFGNVGYSGVANIHGISRSDINGNPGPGKSTPSRVDAITNKDNKVKGTEIAANSTPLSALADPCYIDGKATLTGSATRKRKRLGFDEETGNLVLVQYDSASNIQANGKIHVATVDGVRETGTVGEPTLPIQNVVFEVDDNGFVKGLRMPAYFMEG